MTPADLERLMEGPARLSPAMVRARNTVRLMNIIMLCDKATAEAARAREPGDVFLSIRAWAEDGILANVERAGVMPEVDISPDPIKDACHDAIAAAVKGDAAAYEAAREREKAARVHRAVYQAKYDAKVSS